jgi:hypothetical protein
LREAVAFFAQSGELVFCRVRRWGFCRGSVACRSDWQLVGVVGRGAALVCCQSSAVVRCPLSVVLDADSCFFSAGAPVVKRKKTSELWCPGGELVDFNLSSARKGGVAWWALMIAVQGAVSHCYQSVKGGVASSAAG